MACSFLQRLLFDGLLFFPSGLVADRPAAQIGVRDADLTYRIDYVRFFA
jgi:hypothetical protein